MFLRRLAPVLLAALILTACAAPGAPPATATRVAQAPTSAPTEPPAPTLPPAPTSAPTEPPAPTLPPAPTSAPTAPANTLTIPLAPTPFPTATVLPTAPLAATELPAPTAPPSPSSQPAPPGSELLFLRGGDLYAFDSATGNLRAIAPGVSDFAASPGGAMIALVRGEGLQTELWVVRRDGGGLTRLTNNDRAEATPGWAPDGAALVFGSSSSPTPYVREWMGWSQWCAASAVRVLTLADQAETTLADGCDPALSPDGRRIAYAAPPAESQEGAAPGGIRNSIRLINRQGQNGWNFATADGSAGADLTRSGLLVYAPAWSPDGAQIVYHRFLGYQALVDLDISQIAGSFRGGGQPVATGAGWLLPARVAPDGQTVALVENNYGDARGFGGYDNWSVSVIRLEGTRQIALPSGPITAEGQQIDRLPRGQSVAWSPDGGALAVVLPPGWQPGLPNNEPIDAGERPGELWRWTPGQAPARKLVDGVDFASPLAWLP